MNHYTDNEPTFTVVCRDCDGTEYAKVAYHTVLTRVPGLLGETVHPDIAGAEGHDYFEVVGWENIPAQFSDPEVYEGWARARRTVGAERWPALCAYYEHVEPSPGEYAPSMSLFESAYVGTFASREDVEDHLARNTMTADDCVLVTAVGGRVHMFIPID